MIELNEAKKQAEAFAVEAWEAKEKLKAISVKDGMTDVAARYGGDEFVILLPETNLKRGDNKHKSTFTEP